MEEPYRVRVGNYWINLNYVIHAFADPARDSVVVDLKNPDGISRQLTFTGPRAAILQEALVRFGIVLAGPSPAPDQRTI